ncbi:MAG: hypothetical protein KKB25_03420 [Nanoarchaeota archaeon]|nr:hypothetical protein [Nanoarchaeota archaeon]
MPIKLSELDNFLEAGVGTEYISLGRKIKDYGEEHKRILKAREEEYKRAIFIDRILGEKNYSYSIFNKLAAKQMYYINKDEAHILTDEFSLPVSAKTTIENIEITSPAAIKCEDWEGVRKRFAEESGLIINGNDFYAKFDSLENLMDGIFSVRKAGIKLKLAKKRETQRMASQGYVADESLKPAAVK